MPLYDYQCKQCKQVREVRHGFTDVHTEACTACGGQMLRVFNAAGIVFKGSGFYITDSRKKSSGDSGSAPPPAEKPAATPPAANAAGNAAPAAASTPAPAPAAAESKKSDAA